MTGALLRTGNLKDFHPLGAVGSPVYTAATQLRAAIRRQLGPDVADVFAIPKRNEDGDTIDWYAPRPGNVVPWSSATPEEQNRIKASLLEIRERIQEAGGSMREDPNGERKVFGLLLDKVMSFPSDRHLYLVDGRPVLTFWGFRKHSVADGKDTLALLPVGDGASQATADPAEQASRRFPWWWLLPLLLLLLLLLILLLRGCEEPKQEQLPKKTSIEEATADSVADEPLPESQPEPESPVEVSRVGPDVRVVPGGQDAVHWEGTGGLAGEAAVEELSVSDEVVEPGVAEPEYLPQEVTDEEELAGDLPEQEELAADLPEQQESPPEQPAPEPAALEDQVDAPEEPPAPDDGLGVEPPPGETGAEGEAPQHEPLTIPEEALQSGSTDFLNGQWQSSTGLMESDTGRPIELEYQFQNGRGTARVKRSDGAVCTGPVQAAMKNGQLVIDHATDVVCPDRTAYGRSQVKCRVGENGLADCSGSYATGESYNVGIRRGAEDPGPGRTQ